MGEFDFGQFKEIYDYLIDKLNDGDALTPQEQQVYDMLIGFAGQGLNLTGTADFKSLYEAFNALADEGTKKEFESLYGTNFTQDENGKIAFSRPGTVIEQFMRRGQSVNDGPAMAALSEGLQGYLKQIAQNKFASMTNSYAAMTPIRAQNIQAATNAGNVASTAMGRRVPVAGVAGSGARGAGGAGEGAGEVGPEGLAIDTRGAAGADEPDFMDKYGAILMGLLGTAGLGVGGYLLKDWWNKKPQDQNLEGENMGEILGRKPDDSMYGEQNSQQPGDQYLDMAVPQVSQAYSYPDMNTQMPGGDQSMYGFPEMGQQYQDYNPYQDANNGWNANQYDTGGAYGSGGGGASWQQDYQWSPPVDQGGWDQGWQDQGYWDGGASYDNNSWSQDASSGYWV